MKVAPAKSVAGRDRGADRLDLVDDPGHLRRNPRLIDPNRRDDVGHRVALPLADEGAVDRQPGDRVEDLDRRFRRREQRGAVDERRAAEVGHDRVTALDRIFERQGRRPAGAERGRVGQEVVAARSEPPPMPKKPRSLA